MAQAPTVAVIGLKAFQRDVKRLTGDAGPLNKACSAAGRTAAAPVAAATRSALPQVSGRLAGDVRVSATRSGASVRMGRSSIRYAGWVEFGGHRHAPHESERAYDSRGRYMFPAAVQLASSSARLYSAALAKAFDSFGWSNPADAAAGAVHD
jgi:hypothetical protein